MDYKIILGIRVKKANNTGISLQSLLSKYGGIIRTRLGLNEVQEENITKEGIIILELFGDYTDCQRLEQELLKQDNLEVKKMMFEF